MWEEMTVNVVIHDDYLGAAVHELGHAVAWRWAGIRVDSLIVNGPNQGECNMIEQTCDDESYRRYLVGFLAGCEAHNHWFYLRGEAKTADHLSEYDFQKFADLSAAAPWLNLDSTAARNEARSIVIERWSEIMQWAPVLAESGELSGSVLR